MSETPIGPLRQRMIDDMTARGVKEKVQKDDVRRVRTFAAFLGGSPDTAKATPAMWSEKARSQRFPLPLLEQ